MTDTDTRPTNCRQRLQDEGKPYPKSNCSVCGTLLRPAWKCAHEGGKPVSSAELIERLNRPEVHNAIRVPGETKYVLGPLEKALKEWLNFMRDQNYVPDCPHNALVSAISDYFYDRPPAKIYVTHRLKTLPVFFDAVERGEKTFEVRLNDRNFQVGDTLKLVRFDPNAPPMPYHPPIIERRVTYVLSGDQFGIDPEYVVMGIAPIKEDVSFEKTERADNVEVRRRVYKQ